MSQFTKPIRSFAAHLVAAAAISAFSLAAVAQGASAQTARLGGVYDVTVAGLKIARGSLSLVVQGNAYSAKAGMEPAGIGTIFSTGKGGAQASGWLGRDNVRPSRYTMASRAADRDFYVDIALGGGRVKSADVTPKLKKSPERIKVTPQHTRKVVDPLSAILMPVPANKGAKNEAVCDRTLPVYDGWTRFDIQLSYKEMREVSGRGYDGPVVVCEARWIPVAGHRPSRIKASGIENRYMEAWLAPLGKSRVFVPYRIQMATATGTLVVEANRIKVYGGKDTAAR
ncbi:DUF3108 domain-containing protein [Stappia sp. GBMRC 2046]|uniref:DUF3108 domain-containing protein n=1 Tax=Stappia sediminis TaxID=2692190 RepID=A0A7X3LTY6_9HYPH|nr:DUF3108 domain-containing protein [Stappia sediminis]MXN65034.1 DUF3108 domain-containing protein [Stappia sediminis]